MWDWSFPINKSLWTSSYVLFTGGLAAVALATMMWIVDFNRVRRLTSPFVVYGVNPMVAFVGSGVMARCIYSIFKVTYAGQRISLQPGIYRHALRLVALAGERVARFRARVRGVLVRGPAPAVPPRIILKV